MSMLALAISIAANAFLAWTVIRVASEPSNDELKAAIAYATDELHPADARRFLKLLRGGYEDEMHCSFPGWPPFRDRFMETEKEFRT